MWYELDERQKRWGHLPSIYNAALNNRAGWVAAANAIIKYRMPVLATPEDHNCATEQITLLGTFAFDFVKWLRKFAQTMLEYWETSAYKKARRQSGTPMETWGSKYLKRRKLR